MANWKLSKIQYGFLETATSGGTLTLVKGSKQFQILTGSSNHTVQLPDATTIGVGTGISFVISNKSTGTVTVNYNDTTLFATITAGQSAELILRDAGTSNGTWTSVSTGGVGGGIVSVNPGSYITADYAVVSGDDGRTLNVDTSSSPINITLPAPSANFKVTIKDYKGFAGTNAITILRSGSELIDKTDSNDQITSNYGSVTFISNGTNWDRIASFAGVAPALAGRGLFGGGQNGGIDSNVIDYVTIATTGNATDFGDLTVARSNLGAAGNALRGVFVGGNSGGSRVNTIDYVVIATAANAVDFGDTTAIGEGWGACSSATRAVFAGRFNGSNSNTIEYIDLASASNASTFGTLTTVRREVAAFSSTTRGVFAGGFTSNVVTTADYVTIATTGNAASFGNLTLARNNTAGCASSTRGLVGGGYNSSGIQVDVIDYATTATAADFTDFGDLATVQAWLGASSDKIKGLFAGGDIGSTTDAIRYVVIATTGNSSNFGNLSTARRGLSGCSNAHGGL